MSIFDFLFKKNEEESNSKIHSTLKTSFSNVKQDILHMHKSVSEHKEHTSNKFKELDERIKRIEMILMTKNHLRPELRQEQVIVQKPQNEEVEETEEAETAAELEGENILNVLKGIPRAELKLFRTLYELQTSLNAKHISYKSLASYLYPGKDYNSIRSTITQFVLRLYTEGLVDKQRIGKETYIKITPNGHRLLKNAKLKKLIKESEIIS